MYRTEILFILILDIVDNIRLTALSRELDCQKLKDNADFVFSLVPVYVSTVGVHYGKVRVAFVVGMMGRVQLSFSPWQRRAQKLACQ